MFSGAIVAIVTPFKAGGIDEAGLRSLVEFQIANGTNGIVPCGTTGESPTLSYKEHERVVEIVIEQTAGRIPVIAGTGSNSTEEAISLTEHAKKAGADAALLITPYYNKPTQEGIYRHFEMVAKSVDIPIIVYNIPGRTAVNIEPATMERLSRIDNIIGVKESAGSMKQITDIISLCADDFTVLSGEDYLTFPLMCVGGKGVISVVSNVAPRQMADLCNLFFEGRFEESRKLYYKLLPLLHILFIETNPAPVKAALAMMGKIESEEVRLPLVTMSESNRERLSKVLEAQGLLS
ncbi:MAG: 4-hydroxy-tetrahydrodipicolinate synthase [Deltaproteobacteria bacterium]|jgi:4-hydroxy-tetrahydrodipicolinate synthase|nr:4-hydroxy-tetrahydrodipicolinate synthase [Deltaproteobacteria bacterium]MDA8307810.1 4-hydroxy-tetrahydrodipicolinate synthase [Deltaproteobacteria bacterium]